MHLSTALSLDELAREINDNSCKKGFWKFESNKAEKIALIHSELSEALEAIRAEGVPMDQHCPDYTSETIEMADAIIRILDYCGYYNIPIGEALFSKHEFNKTRPHKHGKKF